MRIQVAILMSHELEEHAIAVLKEDFDPDLEYHLQLEKTFDTHPFHEGALTGLFSFVPDPAQGEKFFVFAGGAVPMIYPDYGLTADELWAVHIGMEYFIKMEITEDTERNFPRLLAYVKMVSTVFQEQLYITLTSTPKVEKIYVLKDQKHVVGKATFNEKVYSWIVGDIPHFVYKKDLPPQVIWALHVGRILLT